MSTNITNISDSIINLVQGFASHLLLFGLLLLSLVVFYLLLRVVFRLLDYWYHLKNKCVFLEVTPSAYSDKTSDANQRFMSIFHDIRGSLPWYEKLILRSSLFTAEITSEVDKGIRFVLRVALRDVATFEHALASYMPSAKIRQVEDYMPLDYSGKKFRITEFKQTGHYALPLLEQGLLEKHDSMAQITGALALPKPGEVVAYQLVVSPVLLHKASALASKLNNNPELVSELGRSNVPVIGAVFDAINTFLMGLLELIGDMLSGGMGRSKHHGYVSQPKEVSPETRQLADQVKHKLGQSLYRVDIRMITLVSDGPASAQRESKMKVALGALRSSKQSLQAKVRVPLSITQMYCLFAFSHRLPSLFPQNSCVLSASELADLYHYPHNVTTNTDNMSKSLSKTLAAPVSLKGDSNLDVVIGRNYHHGEETDIGLVAAERALHMYIVGSTGSGKSTMMKYAIVQDIRNGKGVAVVDPHSDLATGILKYIPEERINDVVYLNPADLTCPIGYNLLEMPEGLDENEYLLEQNRRAEAIMSIFRKVFSDSGDGGHRIEELLRNSIETAMTIKGATIFTVLKLLRNRDFRKKVVAQLEDQDLKDFWRQELGSAGEMQRVSMSKGVTLKIDRFRRSPAAYRMLNQSKSTIDFEDIINSGKILICNFGDSVIGEITSSLLGTMVLAELKMAAERRASMDESLRRPFYLYVDEFQSFATSSFVKMLSGSRKYKLFLTITEQSTAQQPDQRMVESILANVSTLVCFKLGSPADEDLLMQRLAPNIEKGELFSLPKYNFYARMSGEIPQAPVSGETLILEPGSKKIAGIVISSSRTNYGKVYIPPKPSKQNRHDEAEAYSIEGSLLEDDDYPVND